MRQNKIIRVACNGNGASGNVGAATGFNAVNQRRECIQLCAVGNGHALAFDCGLDSGFGGYQTVNLCLYTHNAHPPQIAASAVSMALVKLTVPPEV